MMPSHACVQTETTVKIWWRRKYFACNLWASIFEGLRAFCWFLGKKNSRYCKDVHWHTERVPWATVSRYFSLSLNLLISFLVQYFYSHMEDISSHAFGGIWLFIRKISNNPLSHQLVLMSEDIYIILMSSTKEQ